MDKLTEDFMKTEPVVMVLNDKDRDAFIKNIQTPSEPNQALKDAAAFYFEAIQENK